jgi:hypothetical protein
MNRALARAPTAIEPARPARRAGEGAGAPAAEPCPRPLVVIGHRLSDIGYRPPASRAPVNDQPAFFFAASTSIWILTSSPMYGT